VDNFMQLQLQLQLQLQVQTTRETTGFLLFKYRQFNPSIALTPFIGVICS